MRDIYLKIPFPLDFKIFFFNVSNPMEVQNGAKPVLKEIGPYCYDEYKEKIDVIDNEMEDSLTYNGFDIYEFNAEKSGNLSENDYVTIIHPLIVGMAYQVNRDSPALLSFLNQAIGPLFKDPKSIYLTDTVKNVLFDGFDINCNASMFAAKAVFSRGIRHSEDLGKVLEVDGKKEVTLWSTKACNHFRGTDGWIIPPLLKPEEGLWTHSTDLCRNIKAAYVRDSVVEGVNVRIYEGDLGDMQKNEEEKCYCPTPKTCLRKGVFDVSKCMNIPVLVSLPHFLNADEIYRQQVEGMEPIHDKHIISIYLEAGVELKGEFLKLITSKLMLLKVGDTSRWLAVFGGLVTICVGAYLYSKNRKSINITPIHLAESDIEITRSTNELMDQMKKEFKKEENSQVNPVMTGHEFDRYM
ncbi:unnamed protein product [Phaedon cochleariae]|uniref:Uncharacterized protein n=1 Tax=Phaedon cochleariae TaxID=80249 RepID=A0A9N9SGY4_PHACE|nr:unnamed protein product [Phaedon cochleariae]